MQVIITALGPDNRGLADPIVHEVTSHGANIAEIQMYDHDRARVFAMLTRFDWPSSAGSVDELRQRMDDIGKEKGLTIRTWCRDFPQRTARVAICTTHRPEPARAILETIRTGRLAAEAVVMIGNRESCRPLATEFDLPWEMIGDEEGVPNNQRLAELIDSYQADYIVLARYMRVLPPDICWQFGGGRIINLHHGLLPAFPGARPYHDAHTHRMLTYGATVHFVVPELDAGNQIIQQETFTVSPGTSLAEILRIGQTVNEPNCLVSGLARVLDREVELHFHRIVAVRNGRR
ncbi:Formyltetrahydrofolate deformylase [Planctomycetes bacterium Pan216]|uniref:Formyltetrahydrofolate deformylase n=1 Tax=Kolteria novifilia TaxID=2527975 RepID=A0A518B607_9BACT|nr:Formyltetrahydrofolate deformylase [Planctomycetes bacterium Pan216]